MSEFFSLGKYERDPSSGVDAGHTTKIRRVLRQFRLRAALILLFTALNPCASSNALDQAGAARRPMELDVRDAGVDCSFKTDSSGALNALVATSDANGRAIAFPPGCHVKLERTWLIKNLSGFTVRGTSGAGNNGYYGTNVPTITWSGPPGGTMIDMEFVDGFVVENLAIDGGGTAEVGVNVDRFGAGGKVNTTDGIFRRLNINANFAGAGNAKWVGLQFSMKQLNNVEDMRITDSVFFCGRTPTSGIAAIVIGPSYNTKNFKIEHNFIHLCDRAIWQRGGSAIIAANEIGSSHTDIQLDYWTDPNEQITDNLSESAESGDRFLLVKTAMNHVVEISGNNIPVNDTCSITFNGGEFYSGLANTFYGGYGKGANGHKLCDDGDHGPVSLTGPGWRHNLTPQDIAFLEAVPIRKGSAHTSIQAFGTTNMSEAMLLGTGTRFFASGTFYTPNDAAYGLGNSNSGGAIGSTPCELNTICLYEGASEIQGVASPDGLTCSVSGNGGTQIHTWYISAVDSLGNETFPRNNASASNCYNAPTSYDAEHYETLTWVPSPRAASYRLYLGNPAAPGSQIAAVAEGITGLSYKFTGPFPSKFPLRAADTPYNRTLVQAFRGREFDLEYGTFFRGFSDKRKTQKWSIDSSSGTATFTNIVAGMLQLQNGSSVKCDQAHRGELNYIAKEKGQKDALQICMKAADESYGWRVVY
jgi:hypothetical protein